MPDGVTFVLDQSRMERKTREVFLRVQNRTAGPLTVTAFELTSDRLDPVRWKGEETIGAGYDTDLEFALPTARCGDALEGDVRLTYVLDGGDGDQSISTGSAEDAYGTVTLAADRDCASSILTEAADVQIGTPAVRGTGSESVLELPVAFSPTGARDDVRFGGFRSTVLFRQTDDSPVDVDEPLGPDDGPVETVMRVVPARCDPHALAEDKVGTLFDVDVLADGLPAGTSYYLPIDEATRTALYEFFRDHCGLP